MTIRRLLSRGVVAGAGWFLLVFMVAGCYPFQGRPRASNPRELIREADAACARGDRRAHDTLLRRLLQRWPRAAEAGDVRLRLAEEARCIPTPSAQPRRGPHAPADAKTSAPSDPAPALEPAASPPTEPTP